MGVLAWLADSSVPKPAQCIPSIVGSSSQMSNQEDKSTLSPRPNFLISAFKWSRGDVLGESADNRDLGEQRIRSDVIYPAFF